MDFSLAKDWCLHQKSILAVVSKCNIPVFHFSQNYQIFWTWFSMGTISISILRLIGIILCRQLLGLYQETIQAHLVDDDYIQCPMALSHLKRSKSPGFTSCVGTYTKNNMSWTADPAPENGGSFIHTPSALPCVHRQQFLTIWPCQWPMKWEHMSVVVRRASRIQQDSKNQLRSILNTVSHARSKNVWDSNPNYRIWWEDSLGPTLCFPWVPNSPSVFIHILGLCVHNTK